MPAVDTAASATEDTIPLVGSSDLMVYASDPDGEPLKYLWAKLSGPDTVIFSVNDTTTSNLSSATFGAAGSYTLRVHIYDGNDTVTSDVDILVRPQHFQTVWAGTPHQPMQIVFDSAVFNGEPLSFGDEIGIFDTTAAGAEICVGVGVIETMVTTTDTLTIIAATDDPVTGDQDGFIDGRGIRTKVWKYDYQQEMDSVVNTFDPSFDVVFTSDGFGKTGLVSTNYISQVLS